MNFSGSQALLTDEAGGGRASGRQLLREVLAGRSRSRPMVESIGSRASGHRLRACGDALRQRRRLRQGPELQDAGFGFGASGDLSAFVTAACSGGKWSGTVFQMIAGLTVS
jgi:hypothetical protein